MARWGYTMMTEQSPPDQSVRDARAAEEAGFDFSVSSDHYQPWLESQGTLVTPDPSSGRRPRRRTRSHG